jgi:histidinol dehydrogenase
MEIIRNPEKKEWSNIIKRPVMSLDQIYNKVKPILEGVKLKGDTAVREYTVQFDGVYLEELQLDKEEKLTSIDKVISSLKEAIEEARKNIHLFHESQKEPVKKVKISEGVTCWRKSVPIEKVGLYVPGGSSPLFSTVLMLGIPAKIAGCQEIILCTPPNKNGNIHPAIIYTANMVGISKIFKVGGAQAIAAMSYGTETIPAVNKIFGPGNQYVTAAKQLVNQEGTVIDFPAGPSEVLVVADKTAVPEFIAADLLSQAEHGPDSQVILVTNSEKLIEQVKTELDLQLDNLPRRDIARESLGNSKLIYLKDQENIIDLVNLYAPEHLILSVENPEGIADKIINAGSVFLGNYTPESAGDYASGTNHTLPTDGYANVYGGVSLDSFIKKITFQEISKKGLLQLGPTIETMAAAEELDAHRLAVSIRLNQIKKNENEKY